MKIPFRALGAAILFQGALLLVPAAARADEPTGPTRHAGVVAQQSPAGPTVAAERAGISNPATANSREINASAADPHVGAGQDVALMVVGAAGLVTGLAIGGSGGALVAVAGAAVGLYGLYQFLR